MLMAWLSIQLILLYQYFAPQKIRDACRFEPSCSNYAILALRKYGFLSWLEDGFQSAEAVQISEWW